MMNLPASYAMMATQMAIMANAPFFESVAMWPGDATYDAGGSIVAPGTPVNVTCRVQTDAATDAMRREAGFVERDARLLVLAHGLSRDIDTDARIDVKFGPYKGVWMVQSVTRDPAGIGFECRGRKWA